MRFSRCSLACPRRHSYCRPVNRRGFTLLEVVVGLVLMASVLVSSLLAFSAHQKQLQRADSAMQAIVIADDLLDQFTGSRDGIPIAGRGPIGSRPTWHWQTRMIGTAAPADISLQVVRLEIVEHTISGTSRVLAKVDVVREPS